MKVRNTIQRDLVLEAVRRLNHPTAEEIYNEVSAIYPRISRGTVYRNLNLFTHTGILLKIPLPNQPDHFDTTLNNHYHIVCRSCGRMDDVPLADQQPLIDNMPSCGYRIETHHILLCGLCPACQQLDER